MYVHYVRIFALTVMLGSSVFLTGCTEMVVLAGEKAYNHIRGDFLGIVPEKLDDVYTASLEAATHLDEYQVTEHQLTAINGTIMAFDGDARKTTIQLSKTENDQTQIQIRIGVWGDKIKSVYIYDCIRQRLRSPVIAHASFSTKSGRLNLDRIP
jgi:hypothetical protein